MSRPIPYLLAAALAVSVPAFGVAPAVAQTQRGIEFIADGHGGDWNDSRGRWDGGWDNTNSRWGHRNHRRDHFRPGINFSFGVPFPRPYVYGYRPRSRDCYREWDGSVYCRAY